MKKFTVPNNNGSTVVIIVVAIVGVLVLAIGSYFLFFNKGSFNPIAKLTNKCSGNTKACEHFEKINEYRREKRLSPLKWDSEMCSRIQNFANDLKEIYKDEKNLVFNLDTKKTFDNLRGDTKYKDLIGDYSAVEETRKNDKRTKFDINAKELSDLEVEVDDKAYLKSYRDSIITNTYTHACIVASDSNIEGRNDFAVWFFVELKN